MKSLKLCAAAAALLLSASTAFAQSITVDNDGVLRVVVDTEFPQGFGFFPDPDSANDASAGPATILIRNNGTEEETLVPGVRSIIARVRSDADFVGNSFAFFGVNLEGTIRVAGGSGDDGIAFFGVTTAGIDVRARSGNDEILYFGSTSSGPVILRGARGDDEVDTRNNTYLPGSSLQIRTHSGNDSVLVERDDLPLAAEDVLLFGSTGQDEIGTLEIYAGSIRDFESVDFFTAFQGL